jgi:hypothetical protein
MTERDGAYGKEYIRKRILWYHFLSLMFAITNSTKRYCLAATGGLDKIQIEIGYGLMGRLQNNNPIAM